MSTPTLFELAREAARYEPSVALGVLLRLAHESNFDIDGTEARQLIADALSAPRANGTGPDASEEAFPTLRDLLDRPELLAPPADVIPRLAYRGRTTLLVGPDKSGKSTLWTHAAAALSRGRPFLGERLTQGRVTWCGLDEHLGDTVRRLSEVDADPDRVRLLAHRPPDVFVALRAQVAAGPPDLLVIDSLAEYARVAFGQAPEDGDAAGWGTVVRPIVALGHEHDCAVALLHHPRRSDGQYRGSGEIAAAVDCLLEMLMPAQGEDPTLRRFRGRARWPLADWTLRLTEGRYEAGTGGPLSLDAQILADASTNTGTSRSAQRERLKVRSEQHRIAVDKLIAAGALRDMGHGRGSALYLPHDVTEEAAL